MGESLSGVFILFLRRFTAIENGKVTLENTKSGRTVEVRVERYRHAPQKPL